MRVRLVCSIGKRKISELSDGSPMLNDSKFIGQADGASFAQCIASTAKHLDRKTFARIKGFRFARPPKGYVVSVEFYG